jgi:plastocyanin
MRLLSMALVASALVACGDDKPRAPRPKPEPEVPKQVVDPDATGAIRGVVSFAGTPPADRELPISEVACRKIHGGPVMARKVVVTDGKLQNAFVYVSSSLAGYAFEAPAGEVEIRQRGCVYEPLVAGVRVGQKLTFVNGDTVTHNVHAFPEENSGFNFGQPVEGMRTTRTFDAQEVMVPVKCDIHPWMRAYVGVVDHPFFAVTGPDGAFAFASVPAGEHTLTLWHEEYGTRTATVTVAAGQTAHMDLTVTPK